MTRRCLLLVALCATILLGAGLSAQIATVIPPPQIQFLDAAGNPIASGKLCTYAAGTTTPLATYSDSTLVTQNLNPVLLNAAGMPSTGGLYLKAATYKFILLTAGTDNTCNTGSTVWTQDNVAALAPYNLNALTGTVTFAPTTVLTVSSNAITPTLNVHGVDTAGGAQNLNTVTIGGSLTAPFLLTLYANNGGANPVTVKDGVGNLQLGGGDYTLSSAKTWITLILRGTTWYELARSTTAQVVLPNALMTGRLTLSSGTCVTSADVTAATTVYFTPCSGNTVALFDGSSTWTQYSFSELSIAVPLTTNQMYDVFVYNNAGTPALELAIWTNPTTRATVLTTQNGIYVKSGATTRRYVGSFCTTTVAGQTEDSLAKRYVWNYYNRVPRGGRVLGTSTWNYTLAALRQANAAPANQLEFVIGVAEVELVVDVRGQFSNGGSISAMVSIGEDSTTVAATGVTGQWATNIAGAGAQTSAQLRKYPAVGRHVYAWLEGSDATGTTTWTGQGTPGAGFGVQQSGIVGTLSGG